MEKQDPKRDGFTSVSQSSVLGYMSIDEQKFIENLSQDKYQNKANREMMSKDDFED